MNKIELAQTVDTLYKLRERKKMLDKQIKDLEKPFKDMLKDGERSTGEEWIAEMKDTTRFICDPSQLYDSLDQNIDKLFECISVLNKPAMAEIGEKEFEDISDTVPYQRRIVFLNKEAIK